MKQEPTFIGIDVAKARVEVAVRPGGDNWSVDYDEAGVAGLVDRLQALASALPVAVVNPRQGRILPGPPGNWPRLVPWTPRC